ncbi:5-(carboxyamino)imidazole ribonucleotide synthase [Saccharibacter sp. 17.LH.SD]|uniref:5-(carboxyamino)imidazole ribonucleotide synthase n=1 Tax=Saccharibacter sp. 17.LH.SD TaxID=2689393 RepID=UPI00136E2859|nr:5-(carboxyamino)imidazole ribonucleotide synthase [Saccharibacter sp. 17.LH.SD]MXV43554.1 5-(carboxyamino)imidazole ribonucleotide synthase [Saccharibacter sp. 17.LH.SD]
MTQTLAPGSTIGIIGGGQLGRMSAVAAAQLGYRVHILSAASPAPAADTAASVTVGAYDDPHILEAFARDCDVITFEFENISADGLKKLAEFCPVYPAGSILEISQDRVAEKTALERMGLAVAPWTTLHSADDFPTLQSFGFPLILKTTRFGYDGKGQFRIPHEEAFQQLSQRAQDLPYPLIVERQIDFARELSVMVARTPQGAVRAFDPSENRHRDGILRVSMVPAPIMPGLAEKAQQMAIHLAKKIGLIGILGVEFFQDHHGDLLINEIAPRPHNSGHWTMDACVIDQFEMHIRAVAGLPLPEPRRHSDAFMHNLIGPDDIALLPELFAEENCAIHLYGKAEARPGRKMGHVNRLFPRGGLPGEQALANFRPT